MELLKARTQSLHQLNTLTNKTNLPEEKQLGMNNVPVFDQGESQVESVFASTAAINAAFGGGDHLSQSCLIQLGRYIQTSKNDFTTLRQALSRLENYGYVMKNRQKNAGCENPKQSSINFETYHKFSKGLSKKNIFWLPILDLRKALLERVNTEKTLEEIQQSLHQEQRVTVSFLTPKSSENPLGTVGTHHVKNDTWLMTATIERELYNNASLYFHSMIITGYDNSAVTKDEDGQIHKGLLTLRSSLGSNAGDRGDFYMSYDYFRVLVLEAQQVTLAPSDTEELSN
jgi:hypothetical protein